LVLEELYDGADLERILVRVFLKSPVATPAFSPLLAYCMTLTERPRFLPGMQREGLGRPSQRHTWLAHVGHSGGLKPRCASVS